MTGGNVITKNDSILLRLKIETQSEHVAIEQSLDLVSRNLTISGYTQRIQQFYGFYRPVEDLLQRANDLLDWRFDLESRRKTAFLEQDLAALGRDGMNEHLQLCQELPQLETVAAGFGCLYVLEGATLGGRIIGRHLRQLLDITPETGGRFFDGYGERTGEMWQRFGRSLVAFAVTEEARDQIVTAADMTFRTLRLWCEKKTAL